MADGVERAGDLASCLDANTGSDTVFADGKGITRVGEDSAGGEILGPGSSTVLVEGKNVCLPGDSIKAHGDSPHAAATAGDGPGTDNESLYVLIGEGGEQEEDMDLTLDAMDGGGPYITNTVSDPQHTTSNWCWWYIGDITFSYTVTNKSNVPLGPFNIGLWEVNYDDLGITYILPRGSDGTIDGTWPIFRGETRQGVIPAGGTATGKIVIPSDPKMPLEGYPFYGDFVPAADLGVLNMPYNLPLSSHERGFTMYVDLDEEVIEADETNALPVIEVGATLSQDLWKPGGGC